MDLTDTQRYLDRAAGCLRRSPAEARHALPLPPVRTERGPAPTAERIARLEEENRLLRIRVAQLKALVLEVARTGKEALHEAREAIDALLGFTEAPGPEVVSGAGAGDSAVHVGTESVRGVQDDAESPAAKAKL